MKKFWVVLLTIGLVVVLPLSADARSSSRGGGSSHGTGTHFGVGVGTGYGSSHYYGGGYRQANWLDLVGFFAVPVLWYQLPNLRRKYQTWRFEREVVTQLPGQTRAEQKWLYRTIVTDFYNLQTARDKRNLAKLDQRLLPEAKVQLTQEITQTMSIYHIKKVVIDEVGPVIVLDDTRFRVHVEAHGKQYREKGKRVVAGSLFATTDFEETLFYTRQNDVWLIDYILD